MEGIILDVEIGDWTKIHLLRKDHKEVIKLRFMPQIYVLDSDFYKFETLFHSIISDVEFVKKRIGFSDKKMRLAKISMNYSNYKKLREISRRVSFNIFHLDIYEEHLLIKVPSINPVAIKVNKLVYGEYLWGLNSAIPEELIVIEVTERDGVFTVKSHDGLLKFSSLSELIREFNPSIIVSNKRARYPGVLWLDPVNYKRYGVAGLMEKAYFSYASPRRVVDLTIGNSVESRQQSFALDMDMVLPIKENSNVQVGRLSEYLALDSGGLIITPDPGIYEDVVALDFTSMFPSIILRYNISYETCSLRGVQRTEMQAFLPKLIKEPYERRLYFKRMMDDYAKRRARVLKHLLVASYGYAGKLDNRFGNMYCNYWINKIAREIMIKVISIAKKYGLRVIYADTDSVFVSKNNNLDKFISEIRRVFKLPVKIEHDFSKLVFVRGISGKPVIKRYFGLARDGCLVIKGLMAIRNDVPMIIRKAQKEMMTAILNDSRELVTRIYENYREKILDGINSPDELSFTMRIGKNYWKYKNECSIARIARKYRLRRDSVVVLIHASNGMIKAEYYRGVYNKAKYIELLDKARRELFTDIH